MPTTDEKIRKQFGNRVKELRQRLPSDRPGRDHLSQDDFALKAGLHRTWINAVEQGKRAPSLGNICQLAKALGVTPSELLDGIE